MLLDRVHPARLDEPLIALLRQLGLVDEAAVVRVELRRHALGLELTDRELDSALLLPDEFDRIGDLWPFDDGLTDRDGLEAIAELRLDDRRIGLLLLLERELSVLHDDTELYWETYSLIRELGADGRFAHLVESQPESWWRALLPRRRRVREPYAPRLRVLLAEEADSLAGPRG